MGNRCANPCHEEGSPRFHESKVKAVSVLDRKEPPCFVLEDRLPVDWLREDSTDEDPEEIELPREARSVNPMARSPCRRRGSENTRFENWIVLHGDGKPQAIDASTIKPPNMAESVESLTHVVENSTSHTEVLRRSAEQLLQQASPRSPDSPQPSSEASGNMHRMRNCNHLFEEKLRVESAIREPSPEQYTRDEFEASILEDQSIVLGTWQRKSACSSPLSWPYVNIHGDRAASSEFQQNRQKPMQQRRQAHHGPRTQFHAKTSESFGNAGSIGDAMCQGSHGTVSIWGNEKRLQQNPPAKLTLLVPIREIVSSASLETAWKEEAFPMT